MILETLFVLYQNFQEQKLEDFWISQLNIETSVTSHETEKLMCVSVCTWRIRTSVKMTAWAAFEVNSEAKVRNLWEARQVCTVTCSFEFESPRSLHGKNYFRFDSKTAISG